jgi:hypothetical protein
MSRQNLFVLALGLSLANGLLSPVLQIVVWTIPVWIVYLFPGASQLVILPEIIFYLSSLLVATTTLLVGGVPAALYERFSGEGPESATAMYIWAGACLALSLPAFARFL